MNYSINVTVYVNNTPMIYRVTQTGTDKYYAISATGSRKGFTIKKRAGLWRSEGDNEIRKAILIGEQIDKLNMFGLKGPLCLS
ncbi:MAG: hypothetical protein WKF97_15205 [Chitinophagaceae bacterium]